MINEIEVISNKLEFMNHPIESITTNFAVFISGRLNPSVLPLLEHKEWKKISGWYFSLEILECSRIHSKTLLYLNTTKTLSRLHLVCIKKCLRFPLPLEVHELYLMLSCNILYHEIKGRLNLEAISKWRHKNIIFKYAISI